MKTWTATGLFSFTVFLNLFICSVITVHKSKIDSTELLSWTPHNSSKNKEKKNVNAPLRFTSTIYNLLYVNYIQYACRNTKDVFPHTFVKNSSSTQWKHYTVHIQYFCRLHYLNTIDAVKYQLYIHSNCI